MSIKGLTLLLVTITANVYSQPLYLKSVITNINASFRGLSVVDDSIAWVSGSNGWVGHSLNGGNNWDFKQVTGFEKADFRSLYAFNAHTAIIANAGSPANILLTGDGGLNWQVVYSNTDSAAFFDGMDFWNNKEGIIYGDPLKGHLALLRTTDGGQHWEEVPEQNRPAVKKEKHPLRPAVPLYAVFITKK